MDLVLSLSITGIALVDLLWQLIRIRRMIYDS